MKLRSTGFLGLSVTDRAIACAELGPGAGNRRGSGGAGGGAGGRVVVRRLATFAVPQGLSLDKPEPLGEALSGFLRDKGFAASRAVVGIPAKWLIAMEREIPPAGEDEARAMLRLQAERLAVSESGELVFDYAGHPDPKQSNRVLLVGVLRQRIDQLDRLARSAGLVPAAITSSALALARGARDAQDDAPMLVLGRQGAEMVWRHQGSPKMLRHVSVMAVNGHGPVNVAPLASELGRNVALTRANGMPVARELLLWDGVGLSPEQVGELATRSGLSVRAGDALATLGVEAEPDALAADGDPVAATAAPAHADVFAPALSLALAAADPQLLAVDFKHSRLTPPRERRFGRRSTWGVILGAALVLAGVGLYAAVERQQSEFDQLNKQLKDTQGDVKDAQAKIDRANYGRGFFDTRPPYLDSLREISTLFRDDERIYVTSFSAKETREQNAAAGKENREIRVSGKADTDRTVRALVERLKKDPKFANVQLLSSTVQEGTGNRSAEVSFSIVASYIAPE
jgi:Tfp pilus assembly protein PilN